METKKVKVLIFIESLGCGGAEKSLVTLLPMLDKERLDITLMIYRRGGELEKLIPDDIRTVSPPEMSMPRRLALNLLHSAAIRLSSKGHPTERRWKAVRGLTPMLEEEYDVAVAYQQGYPLYYIAEKVKARRKYAWINTDLTSAGYTEMFNRQYYDQMASIVAVSDPLQERLRKSDFVDPSRLITIHDIFSPAAIRKMADQEIEYVPSPERLVEILTVGRMSAEKGYDRAVRAAKLMRDRGLRFRWTFIGDGEQRPVIEKMIKDNWLEDRIVLLGAKANPYPYMVRCDIYVQTSKFEGFCLTVSEARTLGRPVVCTDLPVLRARVRDGYDALLCKGTDKDLAEKIGMLVTDPGLRFRIQSAVSALPEHDTEGEALKINRLLIGR